MISAYKGKCCSYAIAAEQKARTTYDNILRLVDDPDVKDPIKFLREREIVHFQRFGEPMLPKLNDFRSKNQAVIHSNDRHILYIPYYF